MTLLLLALYVIGVTAMTVYGLLCLLWPNRAYQAASAWMTLVRVQWPDIDWEPYIRRLVPPRPIGLFVFLAGIWMLVPALLFFFKHLAH
jgi:hypothetical protein